MAFKGLFIGIDRYVSQEINWFSCANRDAKALHALFTDTLGGETTLLTDEQATVAAIRARFEQLAACSPDDVVVAAFSGHGTETHELVGHDTDPYDLARTTIPLTTLGEWCSPIPSRRLLVVLDCCFSGGIGAKALQVEGVARDIQSVESKLNRISGEGRVVLTASGPPQRAWENPRLGHSFLTLHLVEALQEPEEIGEGDRIAVLRLLDYSSGYLNWRKYGHAHRFRDTFAVELLSILLGHESVRTTERNYAPWVRSRQQQLEADLTRAWRLDPVIAA